MWWLLATLSVLYLLGTTNNSFGEEKPDNPEAHMNISQIIAYWGYPGEEHEVVTEDGHVLLLNRIPYGKNSSGKGPLPVVYLQHGLLTAASDWVLNLPNNSLAFMLADAGYDVWMGNSRGNAWSRKNIYFSPDLPEFWAFSFDEMAKYDLPATINFILEMTGHEQLYYVGYSQGSTIAFMAFSTDQSLAWKVKVLFALSPIITLKYMTSFLSNFSFFPKQMLKSRLDVYFSHISGTSTQTMFHWQQTTPPFYRVEDMKVPAALWSGGSDFMTPSNDTENLLRRLPNVIYHKKIPSYTHMDFIWGMDASEQIYNELIQMMKQNVSNFPML
ncbi:gastric triacylglycerol lipase-like [Dromiciops gliroides]|uniref:gastric triacylglycerol lipase-like n=1 Tax=Dromiciops gliroides TaxID=33562 RepID=UPI001CC5882D|nr:gastric triacylglycerol lipase-like [Dromiciops gliroides]